MPDLKPAGQASEFGEELRRIDVLLHQRRTIDALPLCDAFVARHPDSIEGWILQARLREQAMDFPGMLASVRQARQLLPGNLLARFIEAEALLHCGEVAESRAALTAIEKQAGDDFTCWRRLTGMHFQMGRHRDAARCADAALRLRPEDLGARQAAASAMITLGQLDEAETALNDVIRRAPAESGAYYNRATLRRQTRERNHVDEIRRVLPTVRDAGQQVPLHYALAKELEDLGEHDESFAELKSGADARRKLLSYRVESDEFAIRTIIEAFDADWAARATEGYEAARPILVLGLPRSGTTLVERILGRHTTVASVGEVNAFAFAVMRIAGPASGKTELIHRSTLADPAVLGQSYWDALRGYGQEAPRLIDKTPFNLLYLGLLVRAMPQARIVHLRRHPIASCYAMYKTLFQSGYPFSYDLTDIGRYYIGYHRLMEHWRGLLPGSFLDLDYETLVDDQEGTSRSLLEFCDLPWEDACLRFHEDASPTATASAAQVRKPLYRDSRDQWRHYARQLAALAEMLEQAGIETA
jgi:tetratricopeptide (TPR) repeat protein